ncbi:MAG: hypothetical protein H0V66_03090, partial [Bdellovibrionales bacterium]|nr:hypothetical protein [Bdellovibrionales bacterium]
MATLSKKLLITLCFCTTLNAALGARNESFYMGGTTKLEDLNEDTIKGHVGGTSNQINRDIGDVPGNRYNGDMSFTYYKDGNHQLERKFDFAALVNDQSLTMWSLQEAYVGKQGVFKGYDQVTRTGDYLKAGRQNLSWSMVDQVWGLGKLN